ncbi:MAG: endonuclease III [Treponemataceae bacterium]|nr:MAG: endonuclease III [Treponemataceae bacterium]
MITPAAIKQFQQTILDNYRANGRSFPWRIADAAFDGRQSGKRDTVSPYAVLVSEMMLQQTQTERVIPKFGEWMARFPDEHSLAAAALADVLALWSGLGYNRRARYLHESAKIIARDGFPAAAGELDGLPGIGPYTARAVITFAFNKPEIFIETNIRSVFIFFFFMNVNEQSDGSAREQRKIPDRDILPLVEKTLYRENPRVWYYALMDYGAALKKKTVNPSRQSAHYAKQSKFKGSLREARGAVLRSLAARGKSSLESIALCEGIEYERVTKAAESLVAENFIKQDDGAYRIV